MVTALNGRAFLGQLCTNPIDIITYVYFIEDSLLMRVGGNEILIEEAKCVGRRCGSEADVKRIKIIEHAFPKVVDGAMALIDNDEVKCFWRKFSGVSDRSRLVGIAAASLIS